LTLEPESDTGRTAEPTAHSSFKEEFRDAANVPAPMPRISARLIATPHNTKRIGPQCAADWYRPWASHKINFGGCLR